MKHRYFSVFASCLVSASVLVAAPALAQSTDTAAERARLGEQRARIEAERRARQEAVQRDLEQQAVAAGRQPEDAQGPTGAVPTISAPADATQSTNTVAAVVDPEGTQSPGTAATAASAGTSRADGPVDSPIPEPTRHSAPDREAVNRVLEQLRELGELKDAGYVTDEEFARIKQRILDGQL